MQRYSELRARHIAHTEPGVEAARELCRMTDEAVSALADAASFHARGRWAIVALGGWGSGALLPRSDLDILILCDKRSEDLQAFAQAVLYPLWDAGLKVGHQVRTVREQVAAMKQDDKSLTATLTARPLAGDTGWARSAVDECIAAVARNTGRTVARIQTRERPDSPFVLEPNLKESCGGRRDYDEMVWTAAAMAKTTAHDPGALVSLGMLTADELADITGASNTVARARWQLHLTASGDRMDLDSLDGELQQSVQDALVTTALTLDALRQRARGRMAPPAPLTAEQVFALLDGSDSQALMRRAALGDMDHLVSHMSELMRLRRPGLGHELTVGAHSVEAAIRIRPLLASLLGSKDRDEIRTTQVAALTHDVGKLSEGAGHAQAGAEPARAAARAFGLSAGQADTIAHLVTHHLLLIDTALRCDLDDEDVVISTAARLGRPESVAPLLVLTAADSQATGPSLWTPWVHALTTSLVSRLDAAFSADIDGAGLAEKAAAVRAEALASSGALDEVASFVASAPVRYLASHSADDVVRHARLVSELKASAGTEAVLSVSAGLAPETHRVTVAAKDAPHLLARLAGAMALAGLDILALDAYRGPDNIALDGFTVKSSTARPVTTETFALLERLVMAALKDRLGLQVRLAERRSHYPVRSDAPVEVSIEQTGWDTRLTVKAPDRPGLLYDIAGAVAAQGIDIRWARAQTVDGVVRDVFHVVGPDGSRVDDPGVLGHLSMGIREAI